MNKNKLLVIVILSVVFGLASGIVGEIVARVYIMESAFGVPLYGDINVGGKSGSNLVIREANKVVVEQNEKLAETAKGVENSVVGIYKKIITPDKIQNSQLANYYRLDNYAGQAFIITSDGWLTTTYMPDDIKASLSKSFDPAKYKLEVTKNFVIINKDRKVFPIDQSIYDKESGYSFWHITATDLPVKKFTLKTELINGQSVFAYNAKGWTWPTIILGLIEKSGDVVKSSDNCQNDILLSQTPGGDMVGSFLFDYNGGLIGILNSSNKISPFFDYLSSVNNLLKTKDLSRPLLGVNYINLSELARTDNGYDKGALLAKDKSGIAVIKNSPADKAGLKENDIIVSVNNTEINSDNELCDVLQQFKAGDEITLDYLRNQEKKESSLVLAKK